MSREMKKYTVDDFVGLGLVVRYLRARVEDLWAGKDGLTLREICDLDLQAEDIIRVVSNLADRRLRVRLGRAYAGHVLPIWKATHPDDSRLGDCLETIDRWLAGEASVDELDFAASSAQAVARAAWSVAGDSTDTRSAAWAVAWVAWAVVQAVDAGALADALIACYAIRAAALAVGSARNFYDEAAERVWQIDETKRILDEYAE